MFAFAIWDNREKQLFVARDRLGVKPLYYAAIDEGILVFASEIRSILESNLVARKLSRPALFEYLQYQSVYAPRTIVENVYQLPAGTYGVFTDGKLTISPYWRLEGGKIDVPMERPAILRDIRRLFAQSIESRMVSDVPVAAFLSGGIDSSAVVAMMSEVSGRRINTFSVTFDEPQFDESEYARSVAERFNTEHSSVRLKATDFLNELPNALAAMDSPSGDGLNTYVVSKATRNAGLKVALSGLGGDELFAGYHYFQKWLELQNGVLPHLPYVGRKLAAGVLSAASGSRLQRMAELLAVKSFDLPEVYPKTRQVISEQTAAKYGKNGYSDPVATSLTDKYSEIKRFPLLSQFTIAELREPFFDFRLVEYMLQVPDCYKLSDKPKNLLVDSLGDLLPRSVVDRRKMGFVLPFKKWMREELKEFCAKRIDALAQKDVLDGDTLRQKWRDFGRGGSSVRWSELWHLVVLTEWLETNKF
jgi:asparagine synthase (glutamine-hydrolysing)